MTDADVRLDGVVRTALQMLPVPAHADDFWTRLEADLDGDVTARRPMVAAPSASALVAPSRPAPNPDPARALLPGSFRRLSNLLLLLVAVAAVVMVALAGKMLLDERNEDQSAPAIVGSDGAASSAVSRLFEAT
ncbi:MAG: hypothetical protein ABIX10_03980 [Acidimicrobiales bacterium]